MNKKHLISLMDWSTDEIEEVLSLAATVKAEPGRFRTALSGKTLGMLFQKKSTRTRVSFEVGMYQLGGHALFLGAGDLQLGRGETISDTAQVLSRYVDAIMARVYAQSDIEDLARFGTVPVINGLSDTFHPCQALADYQTLREHKGALAGLKLAYVGDGNNVAHSLMLCGAKLGVSVSVGAPIGYHPDPAIVTAAQEAAATTGATIEVVPDPAEAVKGADCVYTDVWASMGQEAEQKKREQDFAGFQVDAALMARAAKGAIFMHCLPAHRGEEVSAEVCDSPASVIFDEAENRMHAQKALLLLLMGGV